jgi:hypothetical protein
MAGKPVSRPKVASATKALTENIGAARSVVSTMSSMLGYRAHSVLVHGGVTGPLKLPKNSRLASTRALSGSAQGQEVCTHEQEREYDRGIIQATGTMRFAMSTNKTPSTLTTRRLPIDNVDCEAQLTAFDNQAMAIMDGNNILRREPPRSP